VTSFWRIGYVPDPLPTLDVLLAQQGYGSTQSNGRWHTVSALGTAQMAYCGSSRALCQLEKRVHANNGNLKGQALMRLDMPPSAVLIDAFEKGWIPSDWKNDIAATQAIGNRWLAAGNHLGLLVPSFVEPLDKNLLLNTSHPDYSSIVLTIERNPFVFDPRLMA